MTSTHKAGAIILRHRNSEPEVLVIYRALRCDWTFPKGHIEDEEDAATAVVREVKEETGLDVQIVQPLPDNSYDSPTEGRVTTSMFLVEPTPTSAPLHIEHDGDELRWMTLHEAELMLTHANLKEYVKQNLSS